MAEWPASGVTDWNTKMLAYLAVEHNTDGTHKTWSAYTANDSESNAMLKAHAYKAATNGWVSAVLDIGADNRELTGYVGTTNDPAGAGTVVAQAERGDGAGKHSLFFAVAKDEYFEITIATDTPSIYWKSAGTLSAPVDQD